MRLEVPSFPKKQATRVVLAPNTCDVIGVDDVIKVVLESNTCDVTGVDDIIDEDVDGRMCLARAPTAILQN